MDANMLNRRSLPKYVGTFQVREGDVWLPSCFGLTSGKNLTLHVWTYAAAKLAHLRFDNPELLGVKELCFAD
jgi:hypothetical protein